MPMMLLATFPVQPDKGSTFEDIVATLADIVEKTEPGTTEYRLIRSRDVPGEYTVVESYESREAFDFHRNNPSTRPLLGTIMEMLTDKPVFRVFEEVSLA